MMENEVDLQELINSVSGKKYISVYVAVNSLREALKSIDASLSGAESFWDMEDDDSAVFFELEFENSDSNSYRSLQVST